MWDMIKTRISNINRRAMRLGLIEQQQNASLDTAIQPKNQPNSEEWDDRPFVIFLP